MKRRKPRTERIGELEYSFTVVFDPLPLSSEQSGTLPVSGVGPRRARRNSGKERGYQVTVPLLPGLNTYGRTLGEARAMARDAIRCHLEGLLMAGEPIPDERKAHTEKLRVALTA